MMLGGVRRGLELAGEATGGLQSFRRAFRAIGATTRRSEGRSMLLRLVRTGGCCWKAVLLTGAEGRAEGLAGEDDSGRRGHRRRSEARLILRGGKARGEEDDAKGRRFYLSPRLRRPPDVGGF